MYKLELTAAESHALGELAGEIAMGHGTVEDRELTARAHPLATRLPPRLIEHLERFRRSEPEGTCVVSGLPVDAGSLVPTPRHWRDSHVDSAVLQHEISLLLCASVLGDVFGWATQQDGRIMHDVLPIEGHEHYEIGSNSLQHLSWHTEDSFHPCRGDYVALLCLKNPDGVATTICDAGEVDWGAIDVEILFEPRFTQLPDNSHLPSLSTVGGGDEDRDRLRQRSFALIQSWNDDPVRRPILFGDPSAPYMALDPYHMKTDGWSARELSAFAALCEQLESVKRDVVLRPGQCVFIDNFRAVHGRRAFRPRYDGSDRWLKRVNITRNLRGSRAWRPAADDPIIY